MLIDGALRPARSGRVFETINPATEEVLGTVADGGDADLDDAIAAARRAFDTTTWSTDVALRVRCLRQLQAAFERHADDLRALTVAETGTPVMLTRAGQLDSPVASLGWIADLAQSYAWETNLDEPSPWAFRRTAGCDARRFWRSA
jgi:aldehyde dehydrogenase (NAD+)